MEDVSRILGRRHHLLARSGDAPSSCRRGANTPPRSRPIAQARQVSLLKGHCGLLGSGDSARSTESRREEYGCTQGIVPTEDANRALLRSFLGLCNIYRRFVPRFAALAAPINIYITKGNQPVLGKLSEAARKAFEALRQKLLSPPVLALPRRDGHLWLDKDAFDDQLGCCLLQEQPSGPALPLGYWSRTLSAAERNYSTTEKECLAIVWAVNHLRPYLEGVDFTVRTDHHELRWAMNFAEAQGRLARWRLRLAEFTFKVEYSLWATHHAADVMSRLPLRENPEPPADPIDVDIPVDLVTENCSPQALALAENSTDPIQEVAVLHPEYLFDAQCSGQTARRRDAQLDTDPTWDFDRHGVLVQRLPSGEIELHVTHGLRAGGPYAVVLTLAEDGSVLSEGGGGGVSDRWFFDRYPTLFPAPQSPGGSLATGVTPRPPRILWRNAPDQSSGRGIALTNEWRAVQPDVVPDGQEENKGAVSSDELRDAQSLDELCQQLMDVKPRGALLDLDARGLVIQIAPSDWTRQIVVPRGLIRRILVNEDYPATAGHLGAHRMFLSIRRAYLWPGMAADVYQTVKSCEASARNRITERRKTNFLKLFPAKGPLESVAMDILGPLPKSKHDNRFQLVITDRYSKVTRTVPLRATTALSVARAFCEQWDYVYGAPMTLITDNGPKFTAKVF
jgi:RNase H-like domain found in reverse transcriptase/Integrase zinc binding domain